MNNSVLQHTVNAYAKHGGNQAHAARALGIARRTLQERLDKASALGLKPGEGLVDPNDPRALQAIVRALRAELASAKRDAFTHEHIRQRLVELKTSVNKFTPQQWISKPRGPASSPGVPTLFISDLHWGEKVDPRQINGINAYDLSIARKRMQALIESGLHLLKILSPKMNYPGIVVPLGGDMVTGNIHPELERTNEIDIMPSVLDLYDTLVPAIKFLADELGAVFLPCVTGNHGRDTKKIFAKDRHHTSFDWLLYCFLAKAFENDSRVTFFIPDGPDAFYKVYDHRYLLTHGDQFRGGDGIIGAIGPLVRGHQKKQSRNTQIDMAFDTMLAGHWHQYIHLLRLIVNGSLKGYDEFAYKENYAVEPPQQALWVTHWKYHVTYRMPVLVDRQVEAKRTAWVSVPG